MFKCCKAGARVFTIFILATVFAIVSLSSGFAADRDKPDQPLYNVVAVGRGKGEILLATLAQPVAKRTWRFRKIPLFPPNAVVRNVVLSSSGTKALVVFSDGTPRVFDLTERIAAVEEGEPTPPQHRLTKQFFPYSADAKVCLLDDLGISQPESCTQAAAAAVHEDGHILYALADGHLALASPGREQPEELPYRIPPGAQYQLLAGHRGDLREFLVLITEKNTQAGGATAPTTRIVDPSRPEVTLGEYADPTIAALRAQLEFTQESYAQIPASGESDAALAILAMHLNGQVQSREYTWSFFRVTPNADLYAPVLEFAPGEPAYPSDVDIWEEIKPLTQGDTREAYEAAYASLGDGRWARCSYYVRTFSYPGTWLIEFWYYYPFDEGKPHPHFHDSEHLFVEVDKLGGTVRSVFASDHDSLVPNNIYSTEVNGAPPVTLPLFAMIELGKHAMAADLNHDGVFTRGLDDNLHPERYAFWGIRDLGDKKDALFFPYTASVTLARSPKDRFALADQSGFFPGLDVPANHQVCVLRPFPDDPPCPHCNIASAEVGVTHLVDHPDARAPQDIYKPYVLPYEEVRVGVGIFNRGDLYTAFVGDLHHITGGLPGFPSRMALEYMWAPRTIPNESAAKMDTGVRFENLVTSTQGFYFGITPEWADISGTVTNGVLSFRGQRWQYSGLWYRAGYLLELPSQHKGNFTNQLGVEFQGSTFHFEWRMSFGILRRRGRHDFGAAAGDRNPY